MNSSICLCYHPSTLVLVDDNQDFINAIKLQLKKNISWRFYTDPLKALHYFKEEYRSKPFTQRCFIKPIKERSDQLYFNVDLRKIREEVQFAERFDEISVAVVDYTMPHLDGSELSKQIRAIHPDIRILLLTGEADADIAVQLFNDGIIDKFLKKSTDELDLVLIRTIKELEHDYFLRQSQRIINNTIGIYDKLKCLRDPVVIKLFNRICQERKIVEYYLIDENGSFLLIDNMGLTSWFALVTQQELEGQLEFAEIEKAPREIIESLKHKHKMVYFFTEEELTTPPDKWGPYLYPAQPLHGLETYYYTLIDNLTIHTLQADKPIFYKNYLSSAS